MYKLLPISGISCNVFRYDKREKGTFIYPHYKSVFNYETIVNLLMVEDGENSHYILIKSLDTFLKIRTKYNNSRPTCLKFLQSFSPTIYKKHLSICGSENQQIFTMPDDTLLKFKNFKYRFPNAATIYAGIT